MTIRLHVWRRVRVSRFYFIPPEMLFKTKDENDMDSDNPDYRRRGDFVAPNAAAKAALQATKDAFDAGIRKDKAMNTNKTEDIATLVPNRPDTEVSDELRARMEKALEPIAEIMNEALHHHGLVIGFNGFPFNPLTGKYMAPSGKAIDISRHY